MTMHKPFLPAVLCLLISIPLYAQQLDIIELHNRRAEELVDVIKPLLKANEHISGQNYELYLTAGPETTRSVQEIIKRLDKAPAQLLISVRNSNSIDDRQSGVAINGSIGNDNMRITSETRQDNGVTVSASNRVTTTSKRNTPQIRATEGQPALVYAGVSVPVKMIDRRREGGRIIEREIVDYRPVQSGFYVTAWLNGDNVRLELKQQNDNLGNRGAINTAGLNTTVNGRLGEWIAVGGIDTTRSSNSRNLNSTSSVTTGNRDNIWIKVTRLD